MLLIQSTRRKGWVLPKGGWELDEECTEAATREAWEEAGILIQIDYDLGEITDTRSERKHLPSKDKKDKECRRALYHFYEATVTSEETEWPEKDTRQRTWMTYAQAKETLKDRPELLAAIDRSTMTR